MDLGAVIKDIRKQKNYSQKDFASICEISQAYLSKIENNSKDPNISTLRVIANKLGIPVPILFFLSLDKNDIPENKQGVFDIIGPSYQSLIKSFFNND